MGLKILITTAVAWFGGFVLAPNDVISALVYSALAAFFCAVPLLILGRFAFVKTASKAVHTLVCSLVCLVAILVVLCYSLRLQIGNEQRRINSSAPMSRQASRATRIDPSSVRS